MPCFKPKKSNFINKYFDFKKIVGSKKPTKQFDANKSVDYRSSASVDLSQQKKSRYRR